MKWFVVIIEPQLHYCLHWAVQAEDRAQAKRRASFSCDNNVAAIFEEMKGEPDQEEITNWHREYWACGFRNSSVSDYRENDKNLISKVIA